MSARGWKTSMWSTSTPACGRSASPAIPAASSRRIRVILATGAKAKWLGLPGEEALKGFGVSACATCDGFFFRGKNVVVVGGGNSAVEEALYLSGIAAKVTVVHRREFFRAERILIDRLMARPNVSVKWNRIVEDIVGGGTPKGVTHVILRDAATGALEELATDGVFVAIGHAPQTELVRGKVEAEAQRLCADGAELDRHQRRGPVRGRRRRRRRLSAGGHRGGARLHGGAGGGSLAGRQGSCSTRLSSPAIIA